MEQEKLNCMDWIQGRNFPEALQDYSLGELEDLAKKLRKSIIQLTQETGGHLAANLGVIELTIALLHCFSLDEDRLIWDVGHQCYAYKALTGRAEQMRTLRKQGGLSGFPKREESRFDAFDTGHSSTSLSAALGILRAFRQRGENQRVLAVIGDGALTGGLAWEALNNLSPEDDLLIILNDNGMSISPNVGRLSGHLRNIRVHPSYQQAKTWTEQKLQKLPVLGKVLLRAGSRLKRKTRRALEPAHSVFETLGIRYYGPVDGHNLEDLIRYLKALQKVFGPKVLHICTQKGRGYKPAEEKPSYYHGVSPNYLQKTKEENVGAQQPFSAESKREFSSFTDAFGVILCQLAQEDTRIRAVSAAMTSGTGLEPFFASFPERSDDVGIAEAHALTYAAGLAVGGAKPVVALYSTFAQRGYDQWIHDCCLQKLPVVLTLDRAGLVGADGETHQGLYDLTFSLPLPALSILAPATYKELELALRLALKAEQGPWLIRYPKGAMPKNCLDHPLPFLSEKNLPLPQCIQEGKDLNLLVVGALRGEALEACQKLKTRGLFVHVISTLLLKPLPLEEIQACLCPGKPLVVLEEGSRIGGFGEFLKNFLEWKPGVWTLGLPDQPILQAEVGESRKCYGLDAQSLEDFLWNLGRELEKKERD